MSVLGSSRLQAAVGVTMFVVMVFLLFMSNRTGQSEFDEAKRRLDTVEVLNMRVDGAIFPLLFELQMDFDLLAETERELAEAAERFHGALRSEGSERLARLVGEKLILVNDFKARQAVLRNSRAIAEQMIAALWSSLSGGSARSREDLFEVERAFLEFVGRRDSPSAEVLRETVEAVSRDNAELAAIEEWQVLEAHVQTLIDSVAELVEVMQSVYALPIPQTVLSTGGMLASRLAGAGAAAARYRVALFAAAVLLLCFSAFKVVEVRRYVRLIRRANDELEDRVQRRTEQLAGANQALLDEIAERESVEMQLRLAQKLESIGQLAAGVAHEINTPTQYVSDNVIFLEDVWKELAPLLAAYRHAMLGGGFDEERAQEMWRRADVDYLREEVPAALGQARDGLRQIAEIVLAIKSFSHPGGGSLQPVDINQAIERTVVVARNEWKYVAELTLDLDPDMPAVPCDLSAFNQVMLNLIVNAAHAIDEERGGSGGGHIRVSSRRRGGWAEICVEDNGPGVAEELRERIFDPFFTTKAVGKGTGQGLAIAHRVVGRHGGTLTVEEPSAGKGALFRIRLPLELNHIKEAEVA